MLQRPSVIAESRRYMGKEPTEDRNKAMTSNQSIRSTLSAMCVGSVVGAIVGSLLKSFRSPQSSASTHSVFQALFVSVLASTAVVVAFARKASAQPIISVEDFWEGHLLASQLASWLRSICGLVCWRSGHATNFIHTSRVATSPVFIQLHVLRHVFQPRHYCVCVRSRDVSILTSVKGGAPLTR